MAGGLLLAACGGGGDRPADSWTLTGPLLAWEGDIWIVGGEPVVVPGPLNRDDERRLGALVEARGSFDETGLRVARSVEMTGVTEAVSTLDEVELAGTIAVVDGNLWTIDETEVLLPTATWVTAAGGGEAAPLMAAGSLAEVRGVRVSDERVVALEIVLSPSAGEDEDVPEDDAGGGVDPMPWLPDPTAGGNDDEDSDNGTNQKRKFDKPGQGRDGSDDGNNGRGNDEKDDDE
jgi:hypothetical protein